MAMTFRDTDKVELLNSIMRFYRERLQLAKEAIFPVCHPLNPGRIFPAGGEFFVGVNMGDGQFPLDEEDDEQLREDTDFTVMAYTRMQADWGGRDETFLLDANRGGLALQKKLLIIVGKELTDESGAGLIASRVYPTGTIAPTYDQEKAIGWTGIRCGLEFDWDMSEADDLGSDD